MNLVKELPLRLNQLFGLFARLPVDGSSQMGLFRNLSTHVFRVRNFGSSLAMRVIFFWKCLNLDVYLKNANKNREKFFSFSHKCIWTVCIELSLLWREYLPSAVHVLTKNLERFHITSRNFFQLNYLHSHQWIMVKMLALRLNQSFGPLTMFSLDGSSQMELFIHLPNHVFRGL